MKYRILSSHNAILPAVICALFAILSWGCAEFTPKPIHKGLFRTGIVDQTKNNVRVSAAVLSAEETAEAFGLPLYRKGIQPIWLEIENKTEHRMWFAPVSVDRGYFSPLEVAYMHHFGYSKAAQEQMDRLFHRQAIGHSVEPGKVQSGFVFTNLELGTKAFNVELIGEDRQMRTFTFLIPVAGLRVDHREVDWTRLQAGQEKINLDSAESFRRAVEELPCCATDADGIRPADPINVVIVGRGVDVLFALLRSGWNETASAADYDWTAQLPWEFRYQPVKPLFLFGRSQDAAFRKSRSTLNERNQLRLWLSPFQFEGKSVWVGQISRIVRRAVWDKFVLEPDVDEARTYLLQDLWYAQALLKYGYIRVSGVSPLTAARKSLQGGIYFTDGLCLAVWVSEEPASFAEVQFEPWERPLTERRRLLLGR